MFSWFCKKKYVIRLLGRQQKEYYTVEGELVKFESVEAASLVAKTIQRSTVVVPFKK